MNILLTGASGFLGSALARHLQSKGHQVSLLLRPNSKLERLQHQTADFNIARPQSDAQLQAFVQSVRPNVLIHTACAYGRQGESTLQLVDANLRLGISLLQALQGLDYRTVFINTGTALDQSVNPYAMSKHQLAQWGRLFATQTGSRLQWVNVVLQHMYGAGDDPSKFTTHVLQTCHRNDAVLPLTKGEQRRDFIYIDDVVSAYETLLDKAAALPDVVDIEVGTGQAPTIREFVETAHRLTQSKTELQFGAIPYRVNEAMHCQANIDQIRTLGWQPVHSLDTGLQKTIELEFA